MEFIYSIDGFLQSALQSLHTDGFFGKLWDSFFMVCTLLGEEVVFIFAVLYIYWCYNKRLGESMMLSLYSSAALNGIIKDLVRRPRPFANGNYSVRYVETQGLVDTVSLKESYSFPSGHSMNVASMTSAIAIGEKGKKHGRAWLLVCLVCIPLVMLSRVYLGVHYPTDTLMGAALGVAIPFFIIYAYDKFYEKRYYLFAVVFLVSLSALFFEPTADTIKTLGMGAGALIGFLIESRFIKFDVNGTVFKKILRLLIGAAAVLVIKSGLKAVFPDEAFFWALRYFIIGLFGTAVYPYVFTKYKF
ncbi:MAG: phosphatase PAP2 family protein [Clostridia bacterium]|nr:phosphatase PAP2 family protein [Clostridia bacterium]